MNATILGTRVAIAAIILIQGLGEVSEAKQVEIQIDHPEQVLFLPIASKAMAEYHKKHGEYPKQWYPLEIEFAYGGYLVTDPDVHPKKMFGNRWSPRHCEYTYIIKEADKDHFLIQAEDWAGRINWEIREGQTKPKPVGKAPPKKKSPQEILQEFENLPEQEKFLLDAAHSMHEQHKTHGEYPKKWYLLEDYTYSCTGFQLTDPGIHPKKEDGNRWRPRDCHYFYVIKAADKDHFLIQSLDQQGHPEWEIRDNQTEPTKVKEKAPSK